MLEIYKTNENNTNRYALGKVNGSKVLICIALNPSTATAEKGDRTYTFSLNEAFMSGYDGFIMMNLYPLRSTKPSNLPESCDEAYISDNLKIFSEYINEYPDADIWASWGNGINIRPYLIECLKRLVMVAENNRWVIYGNLTKNGNPRHPSRVKHGLNFTKFSIDDYLKGRLV